MNAQSPPPYLKQLPALFAEPQHEALYKFLCEPGWETGWKSHARRDGTSFLHKHFGGRRQGAEVPRSCEDELAAFPIIREAWLSVKDRVFQGRTLVRCYANGMTYGMDGTVHTDASRPGSYTLVYYPHPSWSPNWGGETLFYSQDESRLIAAAYPAPNSAVLFDGRIPHRASGVSRTYVGVRITLMFKIENVVDETGAQDIPA